MTSQNEIYFVSFRKPGGKQGLMPVPVSKTRGIEKQKGLDVAEALGLARARGVEPTGDVHTSSEIAKAYGHVDKDAARLEARVLEMYKTIRETRDQGESDRAVVKAEFDQQLIPRVEGLATAIKTFYYEVMPTNCASAFIDLIGTTRPSFYRMLQTLGSNTSTSPRFDLLARVLQQMGVLEEVVEIVNRRARQMAEAKEGLVERKEIVDEVAKKPKNKGRILKPSKKK